MRHINCYAYMVGTFVTFCGDQIFVDFVGFLSIIIYKVYTHGV